MKDDIVDRIDQLVDASLAPGPRDDYSVDRYDRCPHCQKSWHGIPVTQRIADMYARGQFDESYRVDTDDSEILCHGSDFIGPMKAPSGVRAPKSYLHSARGWLDEMVEMLGVRDELRVNVRLWLPTQHRWWRTTLPTGATVEHRIEHDLETNTVTIEIGDTQETFNSEYARFHYEHDEVQIFQSPMRRMTDHTTVMLDVLQESAPRIGGTWVPLTAPGVTAHPSDQSRYDVHIDNGPPRVGYTLRDIEEMRSAGWVDVGFISDEGVAHYPTAPAPWVVYTDDDSGLREID